MVLSRWTDFFALWGSKKPGAEPTGMIQHLMMRPLVHARYDPRLVACLSRRRPLYYTSGADPREDRPAHVRAGSGLCWFAGKLCVVQDDANFLALLDLDGGGATALTLPPGIQGWRLFDDTRGNKRHKLDLESCVVVEEEGQEVLLALGSGSTLAREQIIMVRSMAASGEPQVRCISAPELYAGLRAQADFSGSELNIEGAVLLPGGFLRLFQRGNGAPEETLGPINATGDLSWPCLRRYLDRDGNPPLPEHVVQYDLGQVDGISLTFTDAALTSQGHLLYLAGAEDSPDVFQDGEVWGAALGLIQEDGARWTLLTDEDGAPLPLKAEGLATLPGDPLLALVVLDADSPDQAAELCEVRLAGPWWDGQRPG